MCHTIHLPPFYLFVPNSSESADDECRLTISCQRCSLRRQKDAHCQRIRRQEYKNLFTHTHTYAKPRVPSLNLFHPHRPSCDVCVLFDRKVTDTRGEEEKGSCCCWVHYADALAAGAKMSRATIVSENKDVQQRA